ncbi:uncharacterized protein LOC111714282 [Eurytemora carolleeae]|uniref:uncharacterized protein LOC111714282 n=1 Tax=Eurytemora carolleeae TaxID=1294199 RepID=UPI000C790E5E|nr:uncharacterized protein LOC111714282 [Eurytemora carolleeae]|eukprot:XP_023345119.1 uncharacterized protein LOC111714282 [Eurytemora affinis]
MPFSLLNAEAMPDWFLFTQKRVYSGSIMLMTWAFASTIISLGFNSTLRAILLSPSWETFMDSSAQIAEREMTLIWDPEYNVNYDFMMASPNPDIMKIMNTAIFVNSTEDLLEIISEKGFENLVFFVEVSCIIVTTNASQKRISNSH